MSLLLDFILTSLALDEKKTLGELFLSGVWGRELGLVFRGW